MALWDSGVRLSGSVMIAGVGGVGKSTLIEKLKEKGHNDTQFQEDTTLNLLATRHPSQLPPSLDGGVYIILDATVDVCMQRISKSGRTGPAYSRKWIYYFSKAYRMLAAKYSLYLIDTTLAAPEEVCSTLEAILSNPEEARKHRVPSPDALTPQQFDSLPLVAQGESKIVRVSQNEKYHFIKYIPSVYSHTNQTSGMVPGSEIERMKMTREMMVLMWLNEIEHAYLYVGDLFILTRALKNSFHCGDGVIPDIVDVEVIVKNCYTGTDRNRYFDLESRKTRTGRPLCGPIYEGDQLEYLHPYVRFDIRNPNHVYQLTVGNLLESLSSFSLENTNGEGLQDFKESLIQKYGKQKKNTLLVSTSSPPTLKQFCEILGDTSPFMLNLLNHLNIKKPLGDYCISDSLANEFIDVEEAKKTALRLNSLIKEHFSEMNVYFVDFCVMLCSDGKTVYGEISQDCSRCELILDGRLESLTKDVWRAGGSTPDATLLLERYAKLSGYLSQHTLQLLKSQMSFNRSTQPQSSGVALVTGANKGIGLEIAKMLAERGQFHVIIGARNSELGRAAVESLNSCNNGSTYELLCLDVADQISVESAVNELRTKHSKLDILIHNAGVMYTEHSQTATDTIIRNTIETNFFGSLRILKHFTPLLRSGGRIVTVSSTEGQTALRKMSADLRDCFMSPDLTLQGLSNLINSFSESCKSGDWKQKGWPGENPWEASYQVSKAGLTILSKIWANSLKDGVTINSCTPRLCRTDMTSHLVGVERSSREGAVTPVWLALHSTTNGLYYKEMKLEPFF